MLPPVVLLSGIVKPVLSLLSFRTEADCLFQNAAIIPAVFFFFPETKGRSLEELDLMFASAHDEHINPVKHSNKMRHYDGKELEKELSKYFPKV